MLKIYGSEILDNIEKEVEYSGESLLILEVIGKSGEIRLGLLIMNFTGEINKMNSSKQMLWDFYKRCIRITLLVFTRYTAKLLKIIVILIIIRRI
jgi:hypothetical protein